MEEKQGRSSVGRFGGRADKEEREKGISYQLEVRSASARFSGKENDFCVGRRCRGISRTPWLVFVANRGRREMASSDSVRPRRRRRGI